jgi:hypothetical protein
MSFLSGLLDLGKSAVGILSGNSIVGTLARTAILGYAINKVSKNAVKGNDTGTKNIDEGVRLQVNPNSDSKIPVLYGNAFFGGNIIDAAMTNSNKTMWYAIALTEKTGTVYSSSAATAYTLHNVYWNDQRIVFNADGITANYTVDRSGVIDRNISGLVKVYFYAGGRTAGQIPSGYTGTVPNAETLFPNWTAGTHAMNNLVFALIRVDYNREKNVTGLANTLFNISNTLFQPGDVIYDYLTNTTYGAGITAGDILTADITALNTYSAQGVAYADQGTGAETLADRYQINGLIDTKNPVLKNAEAILNATASWLSYDAHEGKWGIVINKADSSIASFNDTNIVGNIALSGTGLQDLYNEVKVQFPHRELRDSGDFYNIEIPTSSIPADWTPFSRNTNEEDNVLEITYDIINEPIQAQMLGLIELKQSRIDKIIQFQTDFGYYNIKAGDIIDITNSRFGFTAKTFRVMSVTEVQEDGGALLMSIVALEYNVNVYSIADLYRFTRSDIDGIIPLGSIGTPGTPVVTKVEIDARPRVSISTTAPTGLVEGIEYWLTTDVGVGEENRSYTLIATKKPLGGGVYTSGTAVVLDYDTLGATNFFTKTRGFNTTTVGSFSSPSGLVEFAPRQTTNAIDANTQAFDATGGLLGALALTTLLGKLSDLFPDATGSIFDKIFQTFEDVTGIDLVGQAEAGDLVVASDLAIKADGSSLGATTASIDFVGPLEASGSSDIEVKIADGIKNKDVLAWNSAESIWQSISDCIDCDFVNVPPADGPTTPCKLLVAQTLPANNFAGSDSTVCPPNSSVPYKGSYFIRFSILPARLGAKPASAGSITPTTDYKYTIAKAGNTDFSWWGAPNNTVGTQWFATAPATNFPSGRTSKEITVGKRYKIRAVGSGTNLDTAPKRKAYWESLGWEGASAASAPTVGDPFTAKAVGTERTATVDRATDDTGFVYGLGALDPDSDKSIVIPISKGTGNFVLYRTDGVIYDTVPIANCTVVGDVVEIPFKQRAPGSDYYVIWTAGIVTNCDCENDAAIDSPTRWTFTTSEIDQTPYASGSLGPANLQTDASDVLERSKIDYTFEPGGVLCGNGQRLKLSFTGTAPVGDPQVIKGSGAVTFTQESNNNIVASLAVSSATLTTTTVANVTTTVVDFGAIPTLTSGLRYIVNAPQGLLTTDGTALSSTFCGKTTTTPRVARPSRAKTWAVTAEDALRITNVEFCPAAQGKSTKRTNIKITFNKPIRVKATSPAEVSIFGGVFGGLFQKIDLRGTFTSKKYGDIYEGADSAADNLDTANSELLDDRTILVNPSQMMSGATDYYMNIPAGVIIDANCDLAWPGVSDSTTIAWTTEGAKMAAPTGSVPLNYGSVKFRWKVDRKTVPGNAFVNITTPAGVFLTNVSAKDPVVKFKHNVPFDFVQTFSGAQIIRAGAAIVAFASSLTARVDNAKFAELGSNIVVTVSANGRRIRFGQASFSGSVVVSASVIRNVGTMTPTALITRSTLRI